MISFHGDSLVPPELCRLLHQVIPEEMHVPVVFFNRKAGYFATSAGYHSSGVTRWYNGRHWIELNLNGIYANAARSGSLAAMLWKALLDVSFHEFGHVATRDQIGHVTQREYNDLGSGAHLYVERIASEWGSRRLGVLLSHDRRLAQPRTLSGYFGARLSRDLKQLQLAKGGSAKAQFVTSCRMLRTGGQFGTGDVLSGIGFPPWAYPTARRCLHRLCPDVGIDYQDAAGRHHRLYEWGDLPIIETRMKAVSIPAKPGSWPYTLEESGAEQ